MGLMISANLCQYILQYKLCSPFRLYIYLKATSSGKRKISGEDASYIAEALGFKSARAVRNNIKILLGINWIGYNKATGYYFIRGFKSIICSSLLLTGLRVEFDIADIQQLKAFTIANVIAKLIVQQKREKRQAERTKGRSSQTCPPSYYPLACEALAKIIGVSVSTASAYKSMAAKHHYITIRKSYKNTGVLSKNASSYLKANPEHKGLIRHRKGRIYLQSVDMVKINLSVRRWKKTERYTKGI